VQFLKEIKKGNLKGNLAGGANGILRGNFRMEIQDASV
jgi:hypothetical protein